MPDNPRLVGRSLRELDITKLTGTVVVGINQDGKKQVNPSGNELVRAGDEWLVVGSSDELRSLRNFLCEVIN